MGAAEATTGAKRLGRAVGVKLVAEVFGRIAQFGTLALAARSLNLQDFGYYGLALVTGFLLAQLADFGLHLSVTRHLSRTASNDFARQALATKLWLLAGLLGLSGLGSVLAGASPAFFSLIAAGLLYGLAEFGFAVLRARNQLSYEARLIILHRFGLLAGAFLTFATGTGLNGLALAHLAASGLIAWIALRLVALRPAGSFDPKLLKSSAPIGLAIFFSLLAFKVDVPLLQLLSRRAEEVGLYNAAYRLFEPLLIFPAALMAGLFPALSRLHQLNPGPAFRQRALNLLLCLLGAGVAAGITLAVLAQWGVTLLYGPTFEGAGTTLVWLALAVPFLFVNSGLTHLLLALNKERYNLWFFAVTLTLNIGANFLLIPAYGRDGAAFATVLTEAALTMMCGIVFGVQSSKFAHWATLRAEVQSSKLEVQSPESRTQNSESKSSSPFIVHPSSFILRWSFFALLVLVICLPFEFTQQPFLKFGSWLTINNLKAVFYLNLALAFYTLWVMRKDVLSRLLNWRSPVLWLSLLMVVCVASTIFSVSPKESLKFTFTLAQGGLFWLALPYWLEQERDRKLRLLAIALVTGASLSAGLGLLEFVPELKLNDWLLSPFKAAPSVAGPFLRLSGTFEYTNIAAIYYELVFPFALAGLASALQKRSKWWQVGLWLVACGLLWEGLLLSFSRSALPGLLVAAPLIAWAARSRQFKRFWPGLGLGFGLGLALVGLTIVLSPVMLLRFKSQSDLAWFQAEYNSPTLGTLSVCQTLTVPVTVRNLTPLDWQGGPDGTYHLSYHWLDRPDHISEFEGIRNEMPPLLKAGNAIQVQAQLRTPGQAGHYWLVWDMVQEDVTWFSLKTGNYKAQPVEIVSTGGTCNTPVAAATTGPNPPSILPVAPANPERGQLWKVAGWMILDRPILGVGPDGYRLAYGAYARLGVWDSRIFANSTPLELAADLGLVGALVFAIFLFLAVWPLLRNGWRGELALFDAAILAGLVAFGLHGLLDYFLGSHAIFILFWILLGLAVSSKFRVSSSELAGATTRNPELETRN